MTLSQRDRQHIWHPFTQEKTAPLPVAIQRAAGSWLYDEAGQGFLDLISSWWVNLHGHAHPAIAKAIYEQACQLEHVIFAGFTHAPAVTLCERLAQQLPVSLSRFFFTDNGSTAVESALKMAYQYWWNQGSPEKTLFLSFEGGYHGDTIGAMSVGAACGFHDPFSRLFFPVETIPFPATWQNDELVEEKERQAMAVLEQRLHTCGDKIAAIILEPLVQGASGMRMCRPDFVRRVVERVQACGILVIFDEVMTGFGRTGSLFALEQTGVVPDFLCLSKGLTGGFLPLALTVTSEKIYQAFLGEHFTKAFAHGHSYTANPLGCAAGLASLDLLLQPETCNALQKIQQAQAVGLKQLAETGAIVQQVRQQGTIAAFEISPSSPCNAQQLKNALLAQGIFLRPLGDTVYLLPPYSTTVEELEDAWKKINKVLCAEKEVFHFIR